MTSGMIEPAINVASREELLQQIRLVRGVVRTVQIDVIDGIFARPPSVADPTIVGRELRPEQVHIHLMVADPAQQAERWLPLHPKRVTIHVEARQDPRPILLAIQGSGSERGLALAPATPLDTVMPFLQEIDFLLFVSVPPGRSGQQFDPTTIGRVRAIHALCPNLLIGVDGGIRQEHIRPLAEAGAGIFSVGSGIFRAPDPLNALRAYEEELAHVARTRVSAL